MYESFFGLRRRPFAASPDADVLVETAAVADAVERLDLCVRQGRGIGVLTAAAGMGKTHLCHRLARLWGADFRVALLPNGSFPTPRGLLQAILAELDQPYQRLGETELLLELTAVARVARTRTNGVVILLDEAHRYSERLLDEVRLIANLVENGEPLIRIVLAGQVELEDKLADPRLAGLNERVGELVNLPRLTADESRQFLSERTAYAGSKLESLFEAAAIDVIVRACGGTPRCLNQLADHGLLLGYVAERRPVDESLVREALDDLKRLPLQWNDPLPASSDVPSSHKEFGSLGTAPLADNVIEIGGLSDATTLFERNASPTSSDVSVEDQHTAEAAVDRVSMPFQSDRSPTITERPASELVSDRFARIDAVEARRRWYETLERAGTPVEFPIDAPIAPPQDSDSGVQTGSTAEVVTVEAAPAEQTPAEQVCAEELPTEAPHEPRVENDVAHVTESSATAASALSDEPRRTPDPLGTLDRIEPLISEALEEPVQNPPHMPITRPEEPQRAVESTADEVLDGREELEELVSTLEQATPALVPAGAPPDHPQARKRTERRSSTLFSDLRRRHRELREGQS